MCAPIPKFPVPSVPPALKAFVSLLMQRGSAGSGVYFDGLITQSLYLRFCSASISAYLLETPSVSDAAANSRDFAAEYANGF